MKHYFRNGRHVEVYTRLYVPKGCKPSFYEGCTLTIYDGTIRGFENAFYRPNGVSRVIACDHGNTIEHCSGPEFGPKLTRAQVIEHFRNNQFN